MAIPNVNSRESTKDKIREVERISGALGEWQGIGPATGFRFAERPATEEQRDYVDIIVAPGMAKESFDWIWCEHALTVGYRSSLTEIVQNIFAGDPRTRNAWPDGSCALVVNDPAIRSALVESVPRGVLTLRRMSASRCSYYPSFYLF